SAKPATTRGCCARRIGWWKRSPELDARTTKKGAAEAAPFVFENVSAGLHHSAHSAHAATAARHCRRRILRQFGDHGFGGYQQASDRACILQRGSHHFGRIDDAG